MPMYLVNNEANFPNSLEPSERCENHSLLIKYTFTSIIWTSHVGSTPN